MSELKSMAELLAAGSRRRHLAAELAAEPGGLVLAANFREGCGVAIHVSPSGGWRASYFDLDGFIGHMVFADKKAAVWNSLGSYVDTNRNLLRECVRVPRFMAGVERSYQIERGGI
jgi:hypothetical protein